MEAKRNAYRILVVKAKGNRPLDGRIILQLILEKDYGLHAQYIGQ
jgi:hypothetical protein